jgi:hypothetical protein
VALGAGRLPAVEPPVEVRRRHVGKPRQFVDVNNVAGGSEGVAKLSLDVFKLLSNGGPALGEFANLLRRSQSPRAPGGVGLLDTAPDLFGCSHC